ncbi:hypothetical protein CR513_38121, partial [Mucuna pruriens]
MGLRTLSLSLSSIEATTATLLPLLGNASALELVCFMTEGNQGFGFGFGFGFVHREIGCGRRRRMNLVEDGGWVGSGYRMGWDFSFSVIFFHAPL